MHDPFKSVFRCNPGFLGALWWTEHRESPRGIVSAKLGATRSVVVKWRAAAEKTWIILRLKAASCEASR